MSIRKSKKGFSLVELLVVITIIAILSVTAYIALGGQTAKARNSRRTQDLTDIQTALEIYMLEATSAPNNYAALESALVPAFINTLPLDPNTEGAYAYAATGKTYQLAATTEDETAANGLRAYVIGTGVADLITTGKKADGTLGACDVVDESDSCVPYLLQ